MGGNLTVDRFYLYQQHSMEQYRVLHLIYHLQISNFYSPPFLLSPGNNPLQLRKFHQPDQALP